MRNLHDRLLLLISAVGLSGILVFGMFALDAAGFGQHWTKLWPHSILLFVGLVSAALSEIRRRSRRLRRSWPLVTTTVAFFAGHFVILSNLLSTVGKNWGMPHFYFISLVECVAFGLVFEQAYARSVSSHGRTRRPA